MPKDMYLARVLDLDVSLLSSLLPGARAQGERGVPMATERGHKNVGILGYSFDAGTDDLRDSGRVDMIGRHVGKRHDPRGRDKNANGVIFGANRDVIRNRIPTSRCQRRAQSRRCLSKGIQVPSETTRPTSGRFWSNELQVRW